MDIGTAIVIGCAIGGVTIIVLIFMVLRWMSKNINND